MMITWLKQLWKSILERKINIDEWLLIYITNICLLVCLNIDYGLKNQQCYHVSFMVLSYVPSSSLMILTVLFKIVEDYGFCVLYLLSTIIQFYLYGQCYRRMKSCNVITTVFVLCRYLVKYLGNHFKYLVWNK